MCGRYFFISSPDETGEHFGVDVRDNFPPRYNIAPTQPVAHIRQGARGREYALARWGFIPSWMKKADGRPMINARSETIAEKPMFRSAFKRRRCLVPADGYYEWLGKIPWRVRRRDEALFAFAGIWETAVDPDGGEIDTLAILTKEAGPDLKAIHHREAVIVPPQDYARWLEADERDVEDLFPLFASSPRGFWLAHEVSQAVNSYRSEGAALIEPVARQAALF